MSVLHRDFVSKIINYLLWDQNMDEWALMSTVVGAILLVWTRSTRCALKVGNIGLKFSSFSKDLFTSALQFYLLFSVGRSHRPRSLRRTSAAVRLLRLWVRIPPKAWMFVATIVLSGSYLCYEPITRPEESYRLWCVGLETSRMWRSLPAFGHSPTGKKKSFVVETWTLT